MNQIKINWNDLNSIRQAERLKSRLENKGYTLKTTISGFNTATLIYKKFGE